MLEANHAIAHLKHWMKPSRRATELLFLTNSLSVTYQPKGVVGIIVPWNFPIYLAVGPLIAALAAGNRVMIKMSEITPATNAALTRLLGEVFQEEEVAVVGEELTDPGIFTSLPFDHIVFTGSPNVGKIVMRTAAENLTPVTLELGSVIFRTCYAGSAPHVRSNDQHGCCWKQLLPVALHEERRWGTDRHDQVELASGKNCANVLDERLLIVWVLDPGRVERDLVEIDRLRRPLDELRAKTPRHIAPGRIGMTESVQHQDAPRLRGCLHRSEHQERYAPPSRPDHQGGPFDVMIQGDHSRGVEVDQAAFLFACPQAAPPRLI